MTPEITTTAVQTNLNVVWTLIAAILVFMMQAGFALVETGFTRAKNAANIMMKNLMDFAAGSLAFYVLGAALMFGATKAAGWFGWGGLGMPSLATGEGVWDWTFLFFQTMPRRRRSSPARSRSGSSSRAISSTRSSSPRSSIP